MKGTNVYCVYDEIMEFIFFFESMKPFDLRKAK